MLKLQQQSMAEFGTIYITTEFQHYVPGNQVTGIIHFNLTKDFPCSEIKMRLYGKEKLKWIKHSTKTVKEGDRGNEKKIKIDVFEDRSDKNYCYDYEFVVYKFDQENCFSQFDQDYIPMGQQQIPFAFVLPDDIPSSFYYEWEEFERPCSANIHYQIMVQMESTLGKIKLLKGKSMFLVNAAAKDKIYSDPNQEGGVKKLQQKEEVQNNCCSKGNVYFTGWFEKDHLIPNDMAYLIVECENESPVTIQTIECKFIQHLKFKTRKLDRTFDNTLSTVKTGPITAQTARKEQDAMNIQIQLKNLEVKGTKLNEGAMAFNTTTQGKLIKCDFFMTLECQTKSSLCDCLLAKNPPLTLPLTVYNPSKYIEKQFECPKNWSPKIMDVYVASLTPAYEYVPVKKS